MIKYAFSFMFLSVIGLLSIPGIPVSQSIKGNKTVRPVDMALDSLYKVTERSAALTNNLKRTTDSLKQLNDLMVHMMKSHDYRVYTYKNPKIKLVYRWIKGKPGHWELINQIKY